MKFEIYDNVKIAKIINEDDIIGINPDYLLGKTGKIISIDIDKKYPYRLEFNDDEIQSLGNVFWAENELELVACNNTTYTPKCFGEYCDHIENNNEHKKCLECEYLMRCSYGVNRV